MTGRHAAAVSGRPPTPPRIAVDGPASSGKSSVGAAVAAALGLRFFDTGLLYRALARVALDRGVDPADGPAVAALAPELELAPDGAGALNHVIVGGVDVTSRVRTADVDRAVPAVAQAPEVRAALLARQREITRDGGILLAGRDIGTVVLPDADVKVWLDASAETRASRRAAERGIDPASDAGQAILADLRRRDAIDGGRAVSPSRPADDAIHVRTDGNTFEETIAAVLAAIRHRLAEGGDLHVNDETGRERPARKAGRRRAPAAESAAAAATALPAPEPVAAEPIPAPTPEGASAEAEPIAAPAAAQPVAAEPGGAKQAPAKRAPAKRAPAAEPASAAAEPARAKRAPAEPAPAAEPASAAAEPIAAPAAAQPVAAQPTAASVEPAPAAAEPAAANPEPALAARPAVAHHASSEAARSAFALPADRLPLFIRSMARFGRFLVLSFTHVTVTGLEHVPTTGPLIVAANHASNVDGGLLIAWVTPALGRPVHWMGKAEALDWPVFGWLLKQLGVFGVRRGTADTEAFRLAKAVLDDGRVLGAFPEGTRSPDGAMQQGKEGVTLLALRTGAPILPIGIAESDKFWPKGRLLWGFGGRLTMRIGEPFALERGRGPGGRKESLEDVTTRLMLHIAELVPERHRGVYGPLVEAAPRADGDPDGISGHDAPPDDAGVGPGGRGPAGDIGPGETGAG